MDCKKCNTKMPQGRVDLGYHVCVDCSTVEAVSCVDITYHKTGNTIQITDKATADRINKLSQRAGYGIMRGLRSGSAPKSSPTPINNRRQPRVFRTYTHDDMKKVLEVAIDWMELGDRKKASSYIESSVGNKINGEQRRKIFEILEVMFPTPVQEKEVEEAVIDPDIEWTFRNWKI